MSKSQAVFVPVCLIIFACLIVHPESTRGVDDWPQSRGPNGDGIAKKADYPTSWTKEKNVEWKVELSGIGASTPIIWKDHLFLTGGKDGNNFVLCLDLNGKQKWETVLGKEVRGRNRKASGSNSSPITDGKQVFVYFKSGELAALDFEGKVNWSINLIELYGRDTLWWDQGTSPILTQDHVIVARMQSGNSHVLAFDKKSGKEAWKRARDVNAPGESAQSYTTPLLVGEGADQTIIILGADHVTAHDAKTGKQKWVCGGLNPRSIGNFRSISSPVVTKELVIAPYARGGTLTAIRRGGSDDVTKTHVAWTNRGPAADVPSPIVSDGKLYTLSDRGKMAIFNVSTGELLTELALPRSRQSYSSSLVLANGHLYATNEAAMTHVVKIAGDKLELVASNDLDDFAVATPVFCNSKIYLRTDKFLYCFATKKE